MYVCVGVHSNGINLLYMVTKCKYTSSYITHVGFTRDVNIGFCFIVQDYRFCVPTYVHNYPYYSHMHRYIMLIITDQMYVRHLHEKK